MDGELNVEEKRCLHRQKKGGGWGWASCVVDGRRQENLVEPGYIAARRQCTSPQACHLSVCRTSSFAFGNTANESYPPPFPVSRSIHDDHLLGKER